MWTVGHNMPGCLPESDVFTFVRWRDAFECLKDEMRQWADDDDERLCAVYGEDADPVTRALVDSILKDAETDRTIAPGVDLGWNVSDNDDRNTVWWLDWSAPGGESSREGRDNWRSEIRMGWDAGDPYGSVMECLFTAAEILHVMGGDVPEELEFRPSPALHADGEGLEDDAVEAAQGWIDNGGNVTAADLVYWCRVLNRYRDLVVAAGRDY